MEVLKLRICSQSVKNNELNLRLIPDYLNFQLYNFPLSTNLRALSSSGRAPHLQCGGDRFDPGRVHQSVCNSIKVHYSQKLCSMKPDRKKD